jgi:hypothetical protein
LLNLQFDITRHTTDNIKDAIKSVINQYNNRLVFENNANQLARHLNDRVHNQRI